jgi:hypothetical protein
MNPVTVNLPHEPVIPEKCFRISSGTQLWLPSVLSGVPDKALARFSGMTV